MDAAQVIAKTMAAAKRPLTNDQQILLAGALAVCMEKAIAAERERPRQVVAYMATNREGEVRFTDNPSAARELEGYGWAITPLADAGPNDRGNRPARGPQEQR